MNCITGDEGLSCIQFPSCRGLALEKLSSSAGCKEELFHMLQHAMAKKYHLLPSLTSAAGDQQPQYHCATRKEEERLRVWPVSSVFSVTS